jgi:hypothetical protein
LFIDAWFDPDAGRAGGRAVVFLLLRWLIAAGNFSKNSIERRILFHEDGGVRQASLLQGESVRTILG